VGVVLTPREIELAIKDGMSTAHVSDDGKRLLLVLRPKGSSRTFQLMSKIEEVKEL